MRCPVKKKLLSSFIFVVVFWWVFFYFYWYMNIQTVEDFFSQIFSTRSLPAIEEAIYPIKISFFYWVLPVLAIISASILFGFVAAIILTILPRKLRSAKLDRNVKWRGIGISIGDLPLPAWKVNLENYSAQKIKELIVEKNGGQDPSAIGYKGSFNSAHEKLLTDILYFIWKNKSSSFVGAGHGVDLYEHTLSVLKDAWQKDSDPLIPIVAAAHDAGKVLAYEKHPESDEWIRLGYHDDYGMLLVATFDSFDGLDEQDKLLAKIAIGYGHKEKEIPLLNKEESLRLEKIFSIVNKADRKTTAAEKKDVIEKQSTPELITNAFIKAIQESPFHTPRTKRGAQSICFKKDNIVYLLEPGFRDLFLAQLPEDLAAAFGDGFRRIGNMSPPTVALINHLKKLGWLVEDGNGMHSECGLWTVEIGKKLFNGVLAVNLPEDISSELPENSEYDVRFSCPLKVDLKKEVQPKDRIPREELSAMEKKAKQLSAIHGGDYEKILEQLKKSREEERVEKNKEDVVESAEKIVEEEKTSRISKEERESLEKKAKQIAATHGSDYQKVFSEMLSRAEAEKPNEEDAHVEQSEEER